jgi:MoxR-like ATPase
VDDFAATFDLLTGNIEKFIRGKDTVVRLALVCLLAEGHLLIEDVPGVAKTSLARALASSVDGLTLRRVQFTPDLLPSDITGSSVYRQDIGRFVFEPGPIFCHVLLGDEINRASPRTQSALLEVMAERQVTVDGRTYGVDTPFICIATQNPIEMQGTYPLPEAQIDRFMMRLRMGYPTPLDEETVIATGLARMSPSALAPVVTLDQVRRMIAYVRTVRVAPELQAYIVDIVTRTRADPDRISLGVSPRGGVALALAAQAHAASVGRDYTIDDDVKAVAVQVLSHRLRLTAGAREGAYTAEGLIDDILDRVPTPAATTVGRRV